MKGLKSTKCGSGESGASFKIRGNQLKVVDGVLQGTGKLIFPQKWVCCLKTIGYIHLKVDPNRFEK